MRGKDYERHDSVLPNCSEPEQQQDRAGSGSVGRGGHEQRSQHLPQHTGTHIFFSHFQNKFQDFLYFRGFGWPDQADKKKGKKKKKKKPIGPKQLPPVPNFH